MPRLRNLAEADGRRGEDHHVERVKDAHPAGAAIGIEAWNQREAADRNRVNRDQRDERRAQPPQDEKDDVAHCA